MRTTVPSTPIHEGEAAPERIALLSDIHANSVALEAVLEALPPVDTIVCLGDVVGYGPAPKRCVEMIRDRADVILRGNHERTLEDPHRYAGHELAYDGLVHAQEELSEEDIDWALDLPESVRYTDDILLCHSHPDPAKRGTYLTERTLHTLAPGFERHGHQVVAFGHTHVQRSGHIGEYVPEPVPDGRFVNPGSVGQPRDGDPRAAFAVLDIGGDDIEIELHRVAYDIERTKRHIESAGLPARSATRLETGD